MTSDEALGIITRAKGDDSWDSVARRLGCSARTLWNIRNGATTRVTGALEMNLRALRDELEAKK